MASMPAVLGDAVTASQALVDPALRKAVSRLDPTMRQVGSYHLGWTDAVGVPTSGASGKGLRPTLTLLGARACGADPERAVPAAVAVELLHNFSLVHDDIMDGDRHRRHRPTVWAEYGVPTAVLAGDALLAAAFEVVLDAGEEDGGGAAVSRCLSEALADLIAGQSADLDFENRSDVSLAEGVAMEEGKTAALMRCAARLGAVSVGAPAEAAGALAEYGYRLGVAFQVVDDLLGIWGSPDVTGKPAMADLATRKKSLPVLAALAAPGPEGDALREEYSRPDPFRPDELAGVADLVERAGGRAWSERRADREVAAARASLDRVDMPADVHEALLALADYVTGRDR